MKPSDVLSRLHWPILLLSFCLALGMWYTVSVRDRLEAQMDIRLDYRGVPDNLIVTDGLVSKMTVRLRGPETLLRAINPQRLNQVLDLSTIKKGKNVIPLTPDAWSPSLRAFEVVEISPPRLIVQADTLSERSLVVEPVLKSNLNKSAMSVANMHVFPASVVVRGPDSVVSGMKSVRLTIPLDPSAPPGPYSQTLGLDVPALVTATPTAVRVSYTVTSGRAIVQLERQVVIDVQNKRSYEVKPRTLTLRVEVPEALIKSGSYLEKAQVSVTPPPLEVGISAPAIPRADLPEGMTLLEPLPEEVTVTKVRK